MVCTAPMLYFLVIKICTALDHVEFTNNMKILSLTLLFFVQFSLNKLNKLMCAVGIVNPTGHKSVSHTLTTVIFLECLVICRYIFCGKICQIL